MDLLHLRIKRILKFLKKQKFYIKKKDFSKIQIIKISILFLILNYYEIALKKIEDLSEIEFFLEKNEKLKKLIISSLSEGNDKSVLSAKLDKDYNLLVKEINEYSNIQIITKNKTNQDILEILNELILDHNEQSNLRRIESLEKKLINNLDEGSYSELIKLKSQLNRE